jgi:hypothetical protein
LIADFNPPEVDLQSQQSLILGYPQKGAARESCIFAIGFKPSGIKP